MKHLSGLELGLALYFATILKAALGVSSDIYSLYSANIICLYLIADKDLHVFFKSSVGR